MVISGPPPLHPAKNSNQTKQDHVFLRQADLQTPFLLGIAKKKRVPDPTLQYRIKFQIPKHAALREMFGTAGL